MKWYTDPPEEPPTETAPLGDGPVGPIPDYGDY
jgi:hypothetical protein